jgi:hypothetical protein
VSYADMRARNYATWGSSRRGVEKEGTGGRSDAVPSFSSRRLTTTTQRCYDEPPSTRRDGRLDHGARELLLDAALRGCYSD